ncbi:MAG: 16S rRNA (cytosine(967)-C(5))-methyltransferase RsmB [Pseudomonadota bacterium]
MAIDPRTAAGKIIGDVLAGKSLNQALPPGLATVETRERALLQELCYGTLRLAPRLQGLLDILLQAPLKKKDRDLQGLLLCGLYQLENTRIPDHAAVSSTVAATAGLKKAWAKGLANAVLRRFQRDREKLATQLSAAAANSHPQWLYEQIGQQWPDSADVIIEANNRQAPMTLRINRQQSSRADFIHALNQQGLEAVDGGLSPEAVYLARAVDVNTLPGFGSGALSVQDEAAQLAAHYLGASRGERILDACAAPGGKACHLLELEPELDELVAMDIDQARLQKVRDNLHRTRLEAAIVLGDAREPPQQFGPDSFDRILVDAPCSATGVLRRNPDIKLLRRSTDIQGFSALQQEILAGLWPLLKPDGYLLYVTCSILKQENADVVERFLSSKPDASAVPLADKWGLAAGPGRQILPADGGPDGLFYALLHKRA